MTTPAGWYPDPWSPSTLRYWDGHTWTMHQAPARPTFTAPLQAPPGTAWNTVWIWLVALLPAVPTLLLLFVPWSTLFDYDMFTPDPAQIMQSQLALVTSPILLASQVLGYLVYGLQVFFAYRDYRVLSERGVPRPFPWAWAFLSPVYPIGRSVVVKRRTGHGSAPLWATIGVLALSLIVTITMMTTMMMAFMEAFAEAMRSVQ